MSAVSLNFHYVTEASAKVHRAPGCAWLNLTFTDEKGARVEVALFTESPESLLVGLAGGVRVEATQEAE
jgi:hypothetical protein